jgi:hypothetical protein
MGRFHLIRVSKDEGRVNKSPTHLGRKRISQQIPISEEKPMLLKQFVSDAKIFEYAEIDIDGSFEAGFVDMHCW